MQAIEGILNSLRPLMYHVPLDLDYDTFEFKLLRVLEGNMIHKTEP